MKIILTSKLNKPAFEETIVMKNIRIISGNFIL